MAEEKQSNGIETTNSIKLMKMSKGYQWEVKLHFPIGAAAEQTLNDLGEIDAKLKATYPAVDAGKAGE